MDNASKALIMAGAILIAVALVGVGVYLYSSATAQVESGTQALDAAEVQTLNSRLEMYEGTSVKGSEIKELVRKVNLYNKQNVFPDQLIISGSGITSGTNGYTVPNTLVNSANYTVTLSYDGPNGTIKTIQVGS